MTISTLPQDRLIGPSSLRYDPRFQVESKSDDFDFTAGLRLVRRRIVMISIIVILLMTVSTMVIMGFKPTFYSETRLMLYKPLATAIGAEDLGRNDSLDLRSETERLLSRSVTERMIADLKLAERPEFNPALRQASNVTRMRERMRGLFDVPKPALPVSDGLEAVILEYYAAMQVSIDGSSNVIRIGFSANDPELAAAAPNRLASIYLDARNDNTRNRLGEAETWFRQRISEQQQRANAAREAADGYQVTSRVSSNADTKGESDKLITDLTSRKSQIQIRRSELKSAISALETTSDLPTALQGMAVPDTLSSMLRSLAEMERNLDNLRRVYLDNAETVVAARAEILKARSNLDLAAVQYVQSMQNRLAALEVEDQSIGSALAGAREQQARATQANINLTRLQQIADNEQKALDKLEEQRRALAGQAMLPGAEVEVLSPATVPLAPQGRGRLFYLVAALLVSVSIAVTVAFIVEMLDRSIRSFDQINALVARLAPLGFIPRLRNADRTVSTMAIGGAQGGMLDEAFHSAMRSLKISTGGRLPRSIAVTSVHSGDGKSLVAKCLALKLAASRQPVLLVDCDLRRQSRTPLFKAKSKLGLNEFLSGQAELGDVIHHHDQSGVDYIPAGEPSLGHRPSLDDMTPIIDMALATGRIVIFDTGPVLNSADTMHLVALAERTLLVAQWGKTSRRAFEFSVQQLKQATSAELLVAINNVRPRRHAQYNFSDSGLLAGKTT